MIDKIHQRPDGTAGRNFRENRARFITPTDFVEVTSAEVRSLFPGLIGSRGGANVILITRRGYLKLVKTLSDDRIAPPQSKGWGGVFVTCNAYHALTCAISANRALISSA